MDYRFRSNQLLSTVVLGCLLTGAGMGRALASMLPPELSENGYLEVGEYAVRIPVANPQDYFWIGERVPLIQKNLEYFVGLIEDEYTQTRVFAVPRMTYGHQGTAWITEQNEIVFGNPTFTVRGSFYLRPGEWLTILDGDEKSYRVLCSRYGKTFPIEVKRKTDGVTFQPDLPKGMEQRVMEHHGRGKYIPRSTPIINDDYLRETTGTSVFRAAQLHAARETPTGAPQATLSPPPPQPVQAPAPGPEPAPAPEPPHVASPEPTPVTAPAPARTPGPEAVSVPPPEPEPEPEPLQVATAVALPDRTPTPEPAPQPGPPAGIPARQPPPPSQVAQVQEATEPEERPRWLISNTSWSQAANDVRTGRTRVVTPETVNTKLGWGDEPEATEAEVEPLPAVASPAGENPLPPVAVAAASTVPTQPPETVADTTSVAEAIAPPVEITESTGDVTMHVAQADPSEIEPTEPSPEPAQEVEAGAMAALQAGAAESMGQVDQAQESLATVIVKVVLFVVAVLAAAAAVVMGLAWVLNRNKRSEKKKAKGTKQVEAPAEETHPAAAPSPMAKAPPPIPSDATEPPAELKDEFSKKMTFNGGVFTGSLDGLTVSQLIQFLHSVQETGGLSVTHGSGQKAGKIVFKDGEIIDVQCEGARAEDALRTMIPFQDGIFAFARHPVDGQSGTINMGTMALLMNVLKDFDEANEVPEEEAAEATAGVL